MGAITPIGNDVETFWQRLTAGEGGIARIAAFVVVVVAWFAILFTGRYPRALFDFVEGVIRWQNRVLAYAFLMVTDRYPPFRLAP